MGHRKPTIVSFYCGPAYYREAAERLRGDCEAHDLDHDIVEMDGVADRDWADICRLKIPFYVRMLEKHPDGILWVDADTRILRFPDALAQGGHDFAAFLRDFVDLREFDAAIHPRTFHPGILHFNATARTRAFLAHLAALESRSDARATDDYFLEEAWRTFEGHLSVQILASDLVAREGRPAGPEACFLFGASGNVSGFIRRVEQHAPPLASTTRQRAYLHHYASQALNAGRRAQAQVFLEKARELAPDDTVTAEALTRLKARRRRLPRLVRAVSKLFRPRASAAEVRRAVEAALGAGDIPAAEQALDRLAGLGRDGEAGFIASRRFRLALEKRARRMSLSPEQRPKLWWMETPYPGNFGDVLNPYIVEKLSGLPPLFAAGGTLAIGSVVKFARAGTPVWGAGTPRMTDTLSPEADYRAVRGPLTRELVLRSGGSVPEIYGDPALLLPLIYDPRPAKKHRLGLVRHVLHADAPLRLEGVHEIDIRRIGYEAIEAFIRELLECEAILSTSLHGLIAAQAYGIPTRWCTLSSAGKALPGDGTKFLDHYAVLGIAAQAPLDLAGLDAVGADLAGLCTERATRPFDALALLDAAPFPVQPRYREAARG